MTIIEALAEIETARTRADRAEELLASCRAQGESLIARRVELEAITELAWGVIANANGGDWQLAKEDWRGAAERWRDSYFAYLRIK